MYITFTNINQRGKNMILTPEDKTEIVMVVMKNGKGLRSSKPKVDNSKPNTGRSAYVWRMVAFQVSKNPVHHCMPCTAEFSLCDSDWEIRKEVLKELDFIVENIVSLIPKEQWYGVKRWAKALGY